MRSPPLVHATPPGLRGQGHIVHDVCWKPTNMDLGLPRIDQRNKQYTRKINRAHFLMLLENTPKLSTITGYKCNTTLPTLLTLNFSTILCTQYQSLSKIFPTTMSFPAWPHAVLGLEIIFFISMTFLPHFLPNFFKTILSWDWPVLMCKATMGFLVVYNKKTFPPGSALTKS